MKKYTEPEFELISLDPVDVTNEGPENSLLFDPTHIYDDPFEDEIIIDDRN